MEKEKEILQKIGKQLKIMRKNAGFTSHENFAFELEISSRYYWDVENGRNFSILYLLKILSHYQITIQEFFLMLEK